MANEISCRADTGQTIYVLLSNSTDQVYSTVGSSFGNYATGSLADYDIALTEQGTASGRYAGNMPAVAAGVYHFDAFIRAGVSPAETDERVWTGEIEWDGSAVVALSSRSTVTTAQVNTECDAAIADAALATAANLATVAGYLDTEIAAILADTNELQTDWANGGRLDLLIDAILADTGELQTDWANGGRLDLIVDAILADTGTDGVVISATTANQIADALLKRDWNSVSGESARSVLNALRLLRNKVSESGGTLTVTKEDDATSAWTAVVTTNASADPITAIDPA